MVAMGLLLAASAGCSEMPRIERPPEAAVKPAPQAAQARSFALERVGETAGTPSAITVMLGALCTDKSRRQWTDQGIAPTDPLFGSMFQEEFARAGYRNVDAANSDEARAGAKVEAADFRIVALVTQSTLSICYPMAGYNNYGDGRGQASLSIDWQVFVRGQRPPIYTSVQRGYGELTSTTLGPNRVLWQQAFAGAVRGLLSDPGFVAAVSSPTSGAVKR